MSERTREVGAALRVRFGEALEQTSNRSNAAARVERVSIVGCSENVLDGFPSTRVSRVDACVADAHRSAHVERGIAFGARSTLLVSRRAKRRR